MIATDPRRMNSRDYTAWLRAGGNLAKGPVPVGEPPVTTTSLAQLSRQLGGDASLANLGPGSPVTPVRTEEEAPRRWDYVPGYNISTQPRKYEGLDFPTLRAFAENYDIARLCIEKRKDDLRSLTWSIRPRQVTGQSRAEAKARGAKLESAINDVTGFFLTPNQEDPWGAWLVQWAHDLFTTDSATLFLRPTLAGQLYGLEVVDGTTIYPIVDEWGRLPDPPDPAYIQVIRGFPSGWWPKNQILSAPYWQTSRSPYGSPPAEWVLMTANRALRRQTLDLSRFTEGTLPAAFLRAPENWDMTQIKELREYLDALLAGNDVTRSRVIPIPSASNGTNAVQQMNPDVTTDAEEWLMHITCAAYGVNPRSLGFVTSRGGVTSGKGDAEVSQDVEFIRSVRNPALHLKGLLDIVIAQALGQPELELWFEDLDQGKDRLVEAQVNQIYMNLGVVSGDTVAESIDEDPPGLKEAYVSTAQGPVLVSELMAGGATVETPDGKPPETPSGAPGENTGETKPGEPAVADKNAPGGQPKGAPTPVGKAAELAAWQRKALRAMKEGRSPAVRFTSDAIADDVVEQIGFALAKSTTPEDVRAAFTLAKAGAAASPLPAPASAGSSATSGRPTSTPSPTALDVRTGSARPLYPSTLRPDIRGARTSPSSLTQPQSFSR
ncbi:MAG TPA: hypothetical protein VMH41_16775 [Mycobacteriales bacterium]|nr:hypothetical protein [Mycobacteriales bacterium]